MKRLLIYLLLLSLLGACAALKPPERKVVGNTFFSSSPKLEVEISPDLDYVGERKYSKDVEDAQEGGHFTLFPKAFIFQGSSQLVAIAILKAPDNAFFLEPSSGFAEIENKLETGRCKLGKRTYHYCIFRLGNQLVKFYAKNVYGASMQVRIIYQETENQEVVSHRELLRRFNDHCEAAFRVK